MPLDAHAHRARRALVVANDLGVDAEARVGEQQMRDERGEQKDDDRRRHAERSALAEPDDFGGQAIDRDAVAQHQGKSARNAEHAERDDERGDCSFGDEETVESAGEGAHRETAEDADPPR